MKRFVIIVTSLFIIFIFIALNYLLWDRESLVTLRDSNQASIDALSRINMNLGEEKNKVEQQAEALKKQIQQQDEKIIGLEREIQKLQRDLEDKSQFILNMKQQLNLEPVQAETMEWVKALSEKKYNNAYQKGGSYCRFWGNLWNLRMFSDYFEQNVESIDFVLEEEKQKPVIEVTPSQKPDWEVNVRLYVQVALKEKAPLDYLKQGENVLNMTYTYSERLEQWIISSVSMDEPAPDDGKENINDPAAGGN